MYRKELYMGVKTHLKILIKSVQVVFIGLLTIGALLAGGAWLLAEMQGAYLDRNEIVIK